MSKLMKQRGLPGQGPGVYKPEAIRVSVGIRVQPGVYTDREPHRTSQSL